MSLLKCTGMTKKERNGAYEFENISFELEEGKMLLLIGTERTSIISALMGINAPQKGEIFYKGNKISSLLQTDITEIAYVPDDYYCELHMSVAQFFENTIAQAEKTHTREETMQMKKEALTLCKQWELNPEQYIRSLKRGENRLMTLINALMLHPKLLVLDNLSSQMDSAKKQKVLEYLKSEKEKGMSIVIGCEEYEEIGETADAYVLFEAGKIKESGRFDAYVRYRMISVCGEDCFVPEQDKLSSVSVKGKWTHYLFRGTQKEFRKLLAQIRSEDIFIVPMRFREQKRYEQQIAESKEPVNVNDYLWI